MVETHAIRALAALAHESRLRVFRLLAKAGEKGITAGKIAEELGLPAATLSFHLKELSNAELITDRRDGRFVFYTISFTSAKQFITYLMEDCCGGMSKLSSPVEPLVPRKRKRSQTI